MGQPSSIDMLPTDILEQLQALLRDKRCTQLVATARINALLAELSSSGQLAEDAPEKLSKTAVNRYSLKMGKIGKEVEQVRELSEMWIAKFGAAPQGKVGLLTIEIVRSLLFEVVMTIKEGGLNSENLERVVNAIGKISLATTRLEKGTGDIVKREEEIRKQERERIQTETKKVVAVAGNGPLTAAQVMDLIEEAMGA